MAVNDRRGYPRWDAREVTAWMFVENREPERCRVIDLSRNGVLIRSPLFLLPGMRIQLAFARTYGSNVTRLFRRWAEVTRSTPDAFAVYFVNPRVDFEAARRGA